MADCIFSGTLAAIPAAGSEGHLYFPTDGLAFYRDDGALWKAWGPLWPCTSPPDDSAFSWINQGTATTTGVNGGVYLEAPAVAAKNMRIRKKAAPSTPYTITALFAVPNLHVTGEQEVGLVFRESSSGKLHVWQYSAKNLSLRSVKYTDPNTWSATYASWSWSSSRIFWLRIQDDGVDRICSYSGTGYSFDVLHTVGRTDFLTADEVGWYVNCETTGAVAGARLLNWEVA